MFAPMKDPSGRRGEEVIAFEAPFGGPQSCRALDDWKKSSMSKQITGKYSESNVKALLLDYEAM